MTLDNSELSSTHIPMEKSQQIKTFLPSDCADKFLFWAVQWEINLVVFKGHRKGEFEN